MRISDWSSTCALPIFLVAVLIVHGEGLRHEPRELPGEVQDAVEAARCDATAVFGALVLHVGARAMSQHDGRLQLLELFGDRAEGSSEERGVGNECGRTSCFSLPSYPYKYHSRHEAYRSLSVRPSNK